MGAAGHEIRVCPNHQDEEKVPLIGTMAFPGAEYWCPGCGYVHGIMGAGEIVNRTEELDNREDYWRKLGKEYLEAKSTLSCSSLMWEGERVSPEDLPEEEKERVQAVIKAWKYKFEE